MKLLTANMYLFPGVLLCLALLSSVIGAEEQLEMAEEASSSLSGSGGDPQGVGCDNCGARCRPKCGTRLFRPCCYHFVRKRSSLAHSHGSNNWGSTGADYRAIADFLWKTSDSFYPETESYV